MSEFFYSDIWKDVQARVISTFALSGTSTVANAINNIEEVTTIQQTMFPGFLEIITIVSGIFSILVAITVLWRFVYWLKDRNKTNKRWHRH